MSNNYEPRATPKGFVWVASYARRPRTTGHVPTAIFGHLVGFSGELSKPKLKVYPSREAALAAMATAFKAWLAAG